MNITGTFTAAEQQSVTLSLAPGEDAEIVLVLTGSHSYGVNLLQMLPGDTAAQSIARSFTGDTASTRWTNHSNQVARLRLQCTALTATETIAYTLRDTVPAEARELVFQTVRIELTATGWVLDSGGFPAAQLPESKTNAGLFVRLPGIEAGDRIVGAYMIGNLTSGGGTVQIEFSLLYGEAANGGATTGEIDEQMTALAVTADTVLGKSNTQIFTNHPVASGQVLHGHVIATTAAGCTAELDALVVQVIRA